MAENQVTFTEQLDAAKQNKIILAKYDKFVEEFPDKIIVDDLIDRLSVFAINHNIKIISFSPAQEKEDDYTKIETININIVAEEYNELIDFIKDIENAPFAIRIETWSARLQSSGGHAGRRRRNTQPVASTGQDKHLIAATVEIAAISLKE